MMRSALAILLVQLAAAGAQECADYVSDVGELWAGSSGEPCPTIEPCELYVPYST